MATYDVPGIPAFDAGPLLLGSDNTNTFILLHTGMLDSYSGGILTLDAGPIHEGTDPHHDLYIDSAAAYLVDYNISGSPVVDGASILFGGSPSAIAFEGGSVTGTFGLNINSNYDLYLAVYVNPLSWTSGTANAPSNPAIQLWNASGNKLGSASGDDFRQAGGYYYMFSSVILSIARRSGINSAIFINT